MTGQRITCCIPGCRRSARRADYDDGEEIICRRHWRTVDPRLRARHRVMHTRWRKAANFLHRKNIKVRDGDALDRLTMLFTRAAFNAWAACKLDATIKSDFAADDAFRRRPRHVA